MAALQGMKVLYVGSFPFPVGAAASHRVRGVSEALLAAGATITVLSLGNEDVVGNLPTPYGDIHYHVVARAKLKSGTFRSVTHNTLSAGSELIDYATKVNLAPDLVIHYGGLASNFLRWKRWAAHKNAPILIDLVERYSPRQLPGGLLGPHYWNSELCHELLYAEADGAICISSYLERRMLRKKLPTVRVPPTFDMARMRPRLESSPGPLRLVYSGNPGKKDLLSPVLRVVNEANRENLDVNLVLVGDFSTSEMVEFSRASWLDVRGRLEPDLAQEEVRKADFSVLLRSDARYSRAGFATKLIESLALGTPIIGTPVGDHGLHLVDSLNSIVCNSVNSDDVGSSILRAAQLDHGKLQQMRVASRKTAVGQFDSAFYSESLESMISAVLHRKS